MARTVVQRQHVQMFAGQKDGMLHGAVANVSPGRLSVGNVPIPVAAQRDGPVRLGTGSRLRVAHAPCTVSSGSSFES